MASPGIAAMTSLSPEVAADRISRRQGLILVAPAALWTVAFFLLPMVSILGLSLYAMEGGKVGTDLTLANYQRFAEQGYFWQSLLNSLLLTAVGHRSLAGTGLPPRRDDCLPGAAASAAPVPDAGGATVLDLVRRALLRLAAGAGARTE